MHVIFTPNIFIHILINKSQQQGPQQKMNSSTLTNEERSELKEILSRIQVLISKELFVPINNSQNVAMNFSMARPWNQTNQTYRKLCTETQTFIKNVSSCSLENLKSFDQGSSKALNQIETLFKSLNNEVQKRVAAHVQAKKTNPYAVGPTQAVINQCQKVIGPFFEYLKRINLQFELINQKFIQKVKKNDPNVNGGQKFSSGLVPIEDLEKLKSQVQFLYKSLYSSFQLATYLGVGRLWNEMMQIYQDFSDQTNGILKNKNSCNEQIVGDFYQKAMKFAYDIHSLIMQMMDELEKRKNTPSCSKSVIMEAQSCQHSIVEGIEKIRNYLKIIKNKYPNIKESNFQGFKKQPQFKRVQINLNFKEIDEFMENKKLHQLLDLCLRSYLTIDESKQKLIDIKYSNTVEIIMEVDIPLNSIQSFKDQLRRKLVKQVDFNFFNADDSKVLKKMLNNFGQKYLLFESRRGGVVLVDKATQVKQKVTDINKEISRILKCQVKDFSLKQKSQLALSKKFLQKKLSEPEYKQIQVRFSEGSEIMITFYGQLLYVNELIGSLEQFVESLEGKILEYNLPLTEQQLSIIEKDQQLKKHIESNWNLTVKYNRNQTILAQISIQPHHSLGANLPEKQITFQTYFNFDSLRAKSLIYFTNKKQLQKIKRSCVDPLKKLIKQQQYKNSAEIVMHTDTERNCLYWFNQQFNPLQVLRLRKGSLLQKCQVFIYLPDLKTLKSQLLKTIQEFCQNQDFIKYQSKITFICKKNQDLQTLLGFKEGKNSCKPQIQRKWFAIDDKSNFYYSQKGNEKIQNAIQKKMKEVELTNQDLNLEVATHSFDFKRNIMTHIVTKKQFPITVHPNKITFELYGLEKVMPDSEFKKIPRAQGTNKLTDCQLSIGFYHIDLTKKIQTNLFSVFQRKIDCENTQKKDQIYDFTIQYDIKTTNLFFQYADQSSKNIKTAVSYVKQNLNKKLIEISQPLEKDFSLQLVRRFLPDAKQQNITIYQSNDKKSVIFKGYNEKNIKNFIKMLSLVEKLPPVQFPKQWQPQTQQIQTFIVPKNTPEFQNVQKAFTAGNIVELVRIQNKLVYKKFHEEKNCLRELNGGKQVKEMLLYHGTLSTDPKLIYEDKEESFNINYTSQRNLLGKGIYFAERSQYSVTYSHPEDANKSILSMFYCRVLVGDSQKCAQHSGDYRDTEFKDPVNRIRYESMTDFLRGSNIFVVYKNRRAYPLYLIKYINK